MPEFSREEMDDMVQYWLDENKRAEEAGDWRPLADLYTEDATYGWNMGPNQDFMAVGRAEIRDIALGQEMGGLDGWTYPYQSILVDERKGEVVGFWKQIADVPRADGSAYEVAGIGGSWFRYAGNRQWSWQRDWFDLGNAAAIFMEMMKADVLSDGMKRRMDRSVKGRPPGFYKRGEGPLPLW
ncbi:nuclear transport factor 2 family protein [Actinomadura sp. 9N407]|uniref:nuclear transport factor 2 family protein n=1 Tax=Actinomadura sp. 9N407 TaxID=3375154 RepID=UPI0037A181E9